VVAALSSRLICVASCGTIASFVTKDQSAQKYRASTTVGKVTEMVWQEHTGVLEPSRSKKSPSETVILLDYRTYLLSIPCHTMLQMRNLIDPHVMHPCEQVSRILSRKTDRIAGGGRRHRLRLEQGVSLTVTIAYRTTTAKPPTIANYRRESHITGRPKTATRAFVRPHCVPNPKIAEIHLLRHCRDRDVMFGRRDMEHKATEVYVL